MKIVVGGQDITSYVEEVSTGDSASSVLSVSSVLGQGAGVPGNHSGRAASATFMTGPLLGPAASAVGAGIPINQPTLLRMAEVKIYDNNNVALFGGYIGKITDKTQIIRPYVQVDCYDYWQHLDRIIVNEAYSGQSDIFIIRDLLSKYAPSISLALLPSTTNYLFNDKIFRSKTLQHSLQIIADITGLDIWIDPNKQVHYVAPSASPTAPFALSSNPDFSSTFPHGVTDYAIDDTSAINRVFFYGGKTPSQDYTQDLSAQVNGINTTFVLAYYPRKASDGFITLKVNGSVRTYGYALGAGSQSVLIRDGGSASYLLNADAHTFEFSSAPSAGTVINVKYRYELPLLMVTSDQTAYSFYGQYLDGVISDETVFDSATAAKRSRILLAEQGLGLQTLKVQCWKGGLQAGMLLRVDNQYRNIHATFIIQQVETKPLGGGQFVYDVTCGAWNWNVVDMVRVAVRQGQRNDQSANEQATPVQLQSNVSILKATYTVTTLTRTQGQYYARSTAAGDGKDAYSGLSSVNGGL